MHEFPAAASAFSAVVASIASTPLRPEVSWQEIPAPPRMAPHGFAADAEVVLGDDELASGRFVLLHNPAGEETWGGTYRVVGLAKARLEPEFATEIMLGDVAWSWVTESIEFHDAAAHEIGCTVTRVVSQSYGALASRPTSIDVELRASWTPDRADEMPAHFAAWTDIVCAAGGLPPAPPEVPTIGRLRQARPNQAP